LPCFGQILNNRNIIKILHSVGEDLEIFRIVTGTLPEPLFDTQIAAAMLGMPLQCRYENLVNDCFGVELPGGQARSDWCRRPLAAGLLRYAAQDVIWLPRLQETLGEALEKRHRLSWLEEDCARLISRARDDQSVRPLLKVKGAGRLDDQQMAWLERLADWRDSEARKRDLPRSFVVKDDSLLELAQQAGRPQQVDAALKRLPPPVQRRYQAVLLDLLSASTPAPLTRPPELMALDNEQRLAIKQAQDAVRQLAESLQLEPAVIASKRELTRLVRGERPDWMDGWRGELLGDLITNLPG
jgi:ribonuclease D